MTYHRRHRRRAGTAAALVLIAVVGCGPASTPSPRPTSAHGPLYAMNRALRIGVKTDQPGIGFADITASRYTGLDIDIANEIAAALHDKPVFQPVISRNREQMLLSGAVDLVIASYSISEERLKVIDFAGPYLVAGQDILIRADDPSITGVDSLRNKITCGASGSNSPTRLAVKFGGTEDVDNPWGKEHLKLLTGYSECMPLLLDKTVDAISTDDTILAGFANFPIYKGRVRVVGKRFASHREKYGIGIAKGNPADTAVINMAIMQMIKDGRWEKIIRKNLGASAPLFLKPEDRPIPPAGG
jgi:glutamate transport system substrate-binding protein